ncbi:MAG TPA: hypothetical protein VG722_03735 [Tepidisphaeraceae bacterium]|nr:hypothetical protein [Tepidisphaeraceae bacterium]
MNDELTEFENCIREALRKEPEIDLRNGVIRAVHTELKASKEALSTNQSWLWAAIAASVLLVMNLSMISASRDAFSISPREGSQSISMELQAIQMITAQQKGSLR